ncbi:FAD-dependent monooxygenase [Deinococcus maricopensis]|uniref:Monooxygenase FAD-binding protein n=1 Tax=Deinococcus maricopensis (strain DSM 21211 / LMG 22137 / NRRL B-23946 / LB-34) TaxID=709986 RepID=E8U4S9_DEIML|nr:FAD-dependent monooxygenase [Deinococcus maricopensis]ADV66068.1 monooxygenase FAD-binding protein [Deinococcus maricopensis DSM 21211]
MNVQIIGAGIGGLAFARALHRRGLNAQVYEAQPHLRSLGGGLLIPPNSARVLERLGIQAVLDTHGVPLRDMQILDHHGRLLYKRDQDAVAAQFGRGLYSVARTALHRALAASLPDGAVQVGHPLTRLEHHFDGVSAFFSTGREVQSDVLIAADGRDSRARQLLFPETHLAPTGQVAYRGMTRLDPFDDWRDSFVEFWGVGRRFTFFRMGDGVTYWHAPLHEGAAGGRALRKSEVLRAYRDFPLQVTELIAATDEAHLTHVSLADLSPMPAWWRGRVALLGDAAHATSPNLGQGAAQALEDADALADLLALEDDFKTAFRQYQAAREGAANTAVAESRQLGEIGQAGGPARWLRNVGLALSPDLARRRLEAFYEQRP